MMKKRILQICFIALFSLFMLTTGMVQLWSNPSLYKTVDENGVFHIRSETDMTWFLQYTGDGYDFENLDVVLETDINMDEVTFDLGNYAGHFDGQGHTISNQRWYLFENLKTTAIVENLKLQDVNIRSGKWDAGGIAYRNYGVIRNCQVSGRIEGLDYVGGIVSGNLGLISDCTNYADIISTQTGETFEQEYHFDGFGAGGIAGISGTSRSEKTEYMPEKNAIINCDNYGSVTAVSTAAGICAYVEDRTNGGAVNLSVQELISKTDFEVYDPQLDSSEGEEETAAKIRKSVTVLEDMVNGIHYSMVNCKNYGTVMVEQLQDFHGNTSDVAGICADLNYGDLYHCANLGRVMAAPDVPTVSDTGWVYGWKPYAITEAMGLSPSINHIVDCVNLRGTMPTTMWPENVMEVTKEELKLWEQGKLPYVSNNWRFQLEEAVRLCSLEPLGVEEAASSAGRKHFYQCEDFVLSLPVGFVIEEKYVQDTCYALRITAQAQALHTLPVALQGEENADFEVWLLRKETDTAKAYTNTAGIVNRFDGIDNKYYMEELYNTIPNYWALKIDTMEPPFHTSVAEKHFNGKRIFMERGLPFYQMNDYVQEGNHVLGNYLNMPLEGNPEEGLEAKWLLVFTNWNTNIRPTDTYEDVILQGLYPLDGKEHLMPIQKGDSLSTLARQYTGDENNWTLLAALNGIENPNLIKPRTALLVPDREAYEKKPAWIDLEWFVDTNNTTESEIP